MNPFRHWVAGDFQQRAEEFRELARDRYDLELDYSPTTLAPLEDWLQAEFGPASADDHSMLIVGLGCYLGEVVVRNLRGAWQADEEFFHSPAVIIEGRLQTRTFPLSRVWKRFEYGRDHSLVHYYQELLTTVSRVKPLRVM